MPNEKEKEALLKNKKQKSVRFVGSEYVLPFCPHELYTEYSVKYTIEKEGEKKTLRQYYKLTRLQPQTNQTDYHFIQINKISPLLIDEKVAQKEIYQMAQLLDQLVFPLRIVVNSRGKWVDLNSYYKIKARWEERKEKIKEAYQGKFYDNITENIESIMQDDDVLLKYVSGNWFLRAYFNGIHEKYTSELETNKSLYFPFLADAEDQKFLITQKVSPCLNDLNLIEVTQKGTLENQCINGSYDAAYFLNPNNYSIEHFVVECDFINMNEKIKIEVKNLNPQKIFVPTGVSLLVQD
ncbi:hypothetical protein B4N84_16335 [Flavobacterium sp. IR1]|uniref:Uncharacterized protein n=1 Tax=Flavobacterium hercynium TaxID=387094 RepID=A0A226GPF8_9FLAO|nr:hypothetical protein B0A66_21760 [Flavobacterium hercynium]PAM93949.1 hypothetical protein B4N84_16335 [Flavobacterium sp. IR1]